MNKLLQTMSYLETTSAIAEGSSQSQEHSHSQTHVEIVTCHQLPVTPEGTSQVSNTSLRPSATYSAISAEADSYQHHQQGLSKTVSCHANISSYPALLRGSYENLDEAHVCPELGFNYYNTKPASLTSKSNLRNSDETEENLLRVLMKTKNANSLERQISLQQIVTKKLPLEMKRSKSAEKPLTDSLQRNGSLRDSRRLGPHPPILRKISLGNQLRTSLDSPTKKLCFDFSENTVRHIEPNEIVQQQDKENANNTEKTGVRTPESRRSSGMSFSSIFAMFSSKRDSCASDTAYVFTTDLLKRRRPLVRANTEVKLQVDGKLETKKRSHAKRFSIISLRANVLEPLKRGSIGFFTDLFPHTGKNGSFAQQVRAGKAVGLMLSLFLLCWLPFLIMWPIRTYCKECISDRLYSLAMWFNYLNSTVNPIIYTLCSPRFRRALKEHWPKSGPCRKAATSKSPFTPSRSPHVHSRKASPALVVSPHAPPKLIRDLKCDYV